VNLRESDENWMRILDENRGGFRRNYLPELSERSFEQRSDREFYRNTEAKMATSPFRWRVGRYVTGVSETFRTVSNEQSANDFR
jgi:hypothetical protein